MTYLFKISRSLEVTFERCSPNGLLDMLRECQKLYVCVCVCVRVCMFACACTFMCVFLHSVYHSLQRNVFYRLSVKKFPVSFSSVLYILNEEFTFDIQYPRLKHIIQGINSLLYVDVMLSAQHSTYKHALTKFRASEFFWLFYRELPSGYSAQIFLHFSRNESFCHIIDSVNVLFWTDLRFKRFTPGNIKSVPVTGPVWPRGWVEV